MRLQLLPLLVQPEGDSGPGVRVGRGRDVGKETGNRDS